MAKKGQEVAVKTESAIIVSDSAPEYIKQNANRGSENVGFEDLTIPRLEIIQGLSPAVKRGDPGYIQGATIGQFVNSVTKELYPDTVHLVPVYYLKQYLVWKARKYIDPDSGREVQQEGGFLGSYATEMEALGKAEESGGSPMIEVIDTPQQFCLLVNADGSTQEVMVSMPRTKAKVARQWNSMIKLIGGDRFARVYAVSTVLEKNTKGDFYNYEVKLAGFPSKDIYARAEKLYESVAKGDRRVVMDVSGFEESTGSVSAEM